MTSSLSPCAVGIHRYVYSGVLLGQRLERCERCGKVRAGRKVMVGELTAQTASR